MEMSDEILYKKIGNFTICGCECHNEKCLGDKISRDGKGKHCFWCRDAHK